MHVQARIESRSEGYSARVSTDGTEHAVTLTAKPSGGSAVNGGELLFLALATCYCNDLYREAKRREMELTQVVVTVQGEFGGPGEPAHGVSYGARVWARATKAAIEALMAHTDGVAEIHNTLRQGTTVTLAEAVAIPS
ncbi:MAG: OsmC family protein [Deinococcales bacterium]|jgi:uncharacterized OsmC-like protein